MASQSVFQSGASLLLAILFSPLRLIESSSLYRNRTLGFRVVLMLILLIMLWSMFSDRGNEKDQLDWNVLEPEEGLEENSQTLTRSTSTDNFTIPPAVAKTGKLPFCGCSKDVDEGEWVLRGDNLDASQRIVRENPLLRTFDDWKTTYWDSNCTKEMKGLQTVWKPRKCVFWDPYFGPDSKLNKLASKSEFDLAALKASGYPIEKISPDVTNEATRMSVALASDPDLFQLFGNKRMAVVGDSLMFQWIRGLQKLFPLASPDFKSPHDRKPDKDLKVVRWQDPPAPWGFNVSFDTLRLNQPGPEFPEIMNYVFDSTVYDVIFVNFGIWYNRNAKPDDVTVRAIRQGNLTGFTPLTQRHYEEDMTRFGKAYRRLKTTRSKLGRWPIVIWTESTPQHFQNGTFTWNVLQEQQKTEMDTAKGASIKSECYPYSSLDDYLAKGHWRNKITQPIIDTNGIPTIHWSKALHYLHSCHPYRYYTKRKFWGNDCTHYCEPSARTVLGSLVTVGCLKEQMERTRSTIK